MIYGCFPARQDSWSFSQFCPRAQQGCCVTRNNANRLRLCATTSATTRSGPIRACMTAPGPSRRMASSPPALRRTSLNPSCAQRLRFAWIPFLPRSTVIITTAIRLSGRSGTVSSNEIYDFMFCKWSKRSRAWSRLVTFALAHRHSSWSGGIRLVPMGVRRYSTWRVPVV
jgi:hypothetical protein